MRTFLIGRFKALGIDGNVVRLMGRIVSWAWPVTEPFNVRVKTGGCGEEPVPSTDHVFTP